jgi:hypothetical protein
MDDVDFNSLMRSVERARKEGSWLVFVGHDIMTDEEKPRQKVQPETLDRLCAYCADPQNGIWVDTFSQVARVVRDFQESCEAQKAKLAKRRELAKSRELARHRKLTKRRELARHRKLTKRKELATFRKLVKSPKKR